MVQFQGTYQSGDTADAVSGASFLCKVTTATRFNIEDGDRDDNTFHLRAFVRLTFFLFFLLPMPLLHHVAPRCQGAMVPSRCYTISPATHAPSPRCSRYTWPSEMQYLACICNLRLQALSRNDVCVRPALPCCVSSACIRAWPSWLLPRPQRHSDPERP